MKKIALKLLWQSTLVSSYVPYVHNRYDEQPEQQQQQQHLVGLKPRFDLVGGLRVCNGEIEIHIFIFPPLRRGAENKRKTQQQTGCSSVCSNCHLQCSPAPH